MPRWRVDLNKKLQHVGIIDAATAEDAINEVAKLFDIRPALRDKLVAPGLVVRLVFTIHDALIWRCSG